MRTSSRFTLSRAARFRKCMARETWLDTAPDVGRLVADLDPIDFLRPAADFPRLGIDPLRHVDAVDVYSRVETALREDVDHDPQRPRIVQQFVLAVDASMAGDRVGPHDRDHLLLHQLHYPLEKRQVILR